MTNWHLALEGCGVAPQQQQQQQQWSPGQGNGSYPDGKLAGNGGELAQPQRVYIAAQMGEDGAVQERYQSAAFYNADPSCSTNRWNAQAVCQIAPTMDSAQMGMGGAHQSSPLPARGGMPGGMCSAQRVGGADGAQQNFALRARGGAQGAYNGGMNGAQHGSMNGAQQNFGLPGGMAGAQQHLGRQNFAPARGGGASRPPMDMGMGRNFVQDYMDNFKAPPTDWGNAMPQLTGKEIGGQETDLTEAKVWGEGEVAQPFTTFNSCNFPKPIMASIYNLGFAAPTPIQAYCWPVLGQGRDLIGIAKTGSGKTLAFLLPPFAGFLGSRAGRSPPMLVMAPTRELACQIQAEAERFGRSLGIQSVCVYGGAPRGPQLREMRQGRHLVVGTPGRLNDYLEGGQLLLDCCSYLVLDEADRMLDMGFEPQIRTIIQAIPPQRQTAMFSATWPREVRHLAADYLRSPVYVQIGSHEATANKDIQQQVVIVQGQFEKQARLREIIQMVGPQDRVIIFVNTKKMCDKLTMDLQYDRIKCVAIHGDREQWERDQALDAFKNGHAPVLAATDVAARGLDIKGVKLVVNFDAASCSDDHIHRIGRTGRAGVPGLAVTFLETSEGRQAREVMLTMQKVGQAIAPDLAQLANSASNGKSWNRFGGKGGGKGKGKGRGGGFKGGGGKGGKGSSCFNGGADRGFFGSGSGNFGGAGGAPRC